MKKRSRLLRSILAATLPPLAAFMVQSLFWSTISPFAWFLFYPTVFMSSWLGGFSGGLGATLLSTALVWWRFIPPRETLLKDDPKYFLSAGAFLVIGILFGVLHERLERANRKLQQANDEITRLYEKTKELDALKNQMFAGVSHELRTPLTLILGPTRSLLAHPDLPQAAREALRVVERNACTLLHHVNDLLEVSRLEARKANPEYAETDLARLTRFVASHFDVLVKEKDVAFVIEAEGELWASVDPEMIQRVLLNLLSNAFKFTPAGGRVRVSLRRAGEKRVLIEVADSGPGVPIEKREAIFERFRQLEGGADRRFGGTGLGLTIARDLVALHDGSISVAEAPEGGALFAVELSGAAPPGASVRARAASAPGDAPRDEIEHAIDELRAGPAAPDRATGAPCGALVLVVEDNPEMNRFIVECLAAEHRVATAFNGKEGLAMAIELKPDLIVTDIMMPVMSGHELVRAIQARVELNKVPILVLSAKADDELRVRLLREGAQDYLTKPFSIEELRARVTNLVAKTRAEKEEQLLAELGSTLASTLDYEEMPRNLASLIVGEFSDVCIVATIDDNREVRRQIVAHRDSGKTEVAAALQRVKIERPRLPVGSSVLDTRRPLLLREVTEEFLESSAQSDEHLRALRALDPKSLIALPLLAHGRLLGALILVRTTTTRRYGPDDLPFAEEVARRAALAVENARLYRTAQRAIAARDETLGIVAHDLRNPLSAILMQTTLLRRSGGEPERRSRKPAEAIERSAKRMSRLIQDLLDVTRAEACSLSIEPARISSGQIVSDSAESQRSLVSSAGLELRVDVAPNLPDVWADRDRLLQVFENLISNAVKFTKPGGRITVGSSARDKEVLFWVTDTGIGIKPDELPYLFDRFWQARKDGRRGAGLGLAIVRSIVEAHGGRVGVESAPGRGTTLSFTIPTTPPA